MKERIERLREQFQAFGIDGLLVTSNENRRYMTGFTGSSGAVLISLHEAVFITDFRYVEQAKKQATAYTIARHVGPMSDEIASQVNRMNISKLGFEQDHMTYGQYRLYDSKIPSQLVPISGLVEKLRLIKDNQEIKILKEAAQIADFAFSHILNFIHPGVTELDVANELEFVMRKEGASSSSFDTIVATGVRSSLPHGVATKKVIEKGDFVTLDFGAYYQGYCSDMTRTIALGKPIKQLEDIYHIVLEAQLRGLSGFKPGMTGKEADALTRDYITEKGYGQYFGHSTGHGIGLEIHEGPSLSIASENVILKPGMVVTCEPGIYITGVGGVRIEDDTIITETGNEILTHSPKELIIIGE